jgi:hypothetical protein
MEMDASIRHDWPDAARQAYGLRLRKYAGGAARLVAMLGLATLVHPEGTRIVAEMDPARWLIYLGFGLLAAIINRPKLLPGKGAYALLAVMFMALVVIDLTFDWATVVIWLPMSFSDWLTGKIDTYGVRLAFLIGLIMAAVVVGWGLRFDPSFRAYLEAHAVVAAWIFGVNAVAEIADRYWDHIPLLANRYLYDLGCLLFLLLSRPRHEVSVFLLFMTYSLFYRSGNLALLLAFPRRALELPAAPGQH